ncbi:hypothetical protein skT53_13540 [Effusibacillus dendaii]|uniref:Alkyl hydroperoxide reductase subunit C/ Thiol specific antioxidant domain-containing protein n=1 Tax=Effusibacillus dendaii TaxID=2743772 RepID=A0A7I8DBN7_9BACL|nr:hypothetical protein skT53_13540 [Effusibacillus dendaii]
MHEVYPDFRKAGAQLFAISVEKPERIKEMVQKHGLSFPCLSDEGGQTARNYNILWELSPALQAQYREGLKFDLSQVSANSGWHLPVPATFIIDRNGVIRSALVDQDFTKRMEPSDILDTLKTI